MLIIIVSDVYEKDVARQTSPTGGSATPVDSMPSVRFTICDEAGLLSASISAQLHAAEK